MKKTYSIILALLTTGVIFTISSCKKEEVKSEFIVNGVSDVSLDHGFGAIGIMVEHVSGSQKSVNLAVHGLPEGIDYDFSSWSGTPSFATSLTFTTTGNHEGNTFPVRLHATNGSVEKEYTFTVKSEPAEDCVSSIADGIAKRGEGNIDEKGVNISCTVTPDYRNRLVIDVTGKNDPTTNLSIYMDINCFMNTVNIPQQTLSSGETIMGSGTINWIWMDINYTLTDQDGNSEDHKLAVYLQ